MIQRFSAAMISNFRQAVSHGVVRARGEVSSHPLVLIIPCFYAIATGERTAFGSGTIHCDSSSA